MNVTVQHLTSTGIGRTVNMLRKDDGEIGTAAKALISKWKQMVASQESEGEEEKIEDVIIYDDEESNKVMTETISNSEKKTHKTREHMPGKNSSSSNHHHHQYQAHAHGTLVDSHSQKRKVCQMIENVD